MPTLTATEERSKLYRLIDKAASSHEPIIPNYAFQIPKRKNFFNIGLLYIKGKRVNAVLISEDDWRAVQETIYLLNIPGMRESFERD